MLTAEQLRASRAILQIDQSDLAVLAGVSVETIKRLEKMKGEIKANRETIKRVRETVLRLGVEFIDSGDFSPTGGPGVRLALSREQQIRGSITSILYTYVSLSVARAWSRAEEDKVPIDLSICIDVQNEMNKYLNEIFTDVGDLLEGRSMVSEDGYIYRSGPNADSTTRLD